MLGFEERGKPEYPGEKPLSQSKLKLRRK